MRKPLLTGALLAAIAVPAVATAVITGNTVEPKAKIGGDGERAKLTVLLSCDEEQAAKLKVTVTQGSAEGQERALGRGGEKVECGTEDAGYPVVVAAKKGSFSAGKSTACVLALTDDDARQWCVDVKLVS